MSAVDRIVQASKWPVALLAVAFAPGLARAALRAVLALDPARDAALLLGFGGYLLLWQLLFRRRFLGSLLPTLLHELTHALFATLTLHRVIGLRATWRSGGRVTFQGRGNWLIFTAPYFFPLLVVVLLVVLALLPTAPRFETRALLGAAVAFQILATWRETHAGQTDLQRVGYPFSLMFLPAANLAALALVLRFSASGTAGLRAFAADVAWWAARLRDYAASI